MVPDLRRYDVIAPKPAFPRFADERTPASGSVRELFSKTHGRAVVRSRDRRATPRVQIELCCEDRSGRSPYYRTTWDVSTFGLSTQYGLSHPVGKTLQLRLHLPDDLRRPLDLEAEVVGQHDEAGGMRLAFRNPPAESVRRIHRYLFSRSGEALAQA